MIIMWQCLAASAAMKCRPKKRQKSLWYVHKYDKMRKLADNCHSSVGWIDNFWTDMRTHARLRSHIDMCANSETSMTPDQLPLDSNYILAGPGGTTTCQFSILYVNSKSNNDLWDKIIERKLFWIGYILNEPKDALILSLKLSIA